VPDSLYDDPRLAALYDIFDDDRTDLDLYAGIAAELGAGRVLDLGCGTGTLAIRLAAAGFEVLGADPARASLDVARGKPGAGPVTWHLGDATSLPAWPADLVTMTGNAAQAVLGAAWPTTLAGVRRALRPGGTFAFESRVPARRAWEGWTPERTRLRREVPCVGTVETWAELTEVAEPLVSFRHTFLFPDGSRLTSDSTLRFRTLAELRADLAVAGLAVIDVRDAPDRPGLEHVVLAVRAD
jgi:SAM-dependent methyltransferase